MKNGYNDIMNVTEDTSVSVCRAVCDRRLAAELADDLTIPDYLPEIRRLIRVDVTPSAPSKFISGGSVRVSGGLTYNVCYVGADGKTYGTETVGEYSLEAPFDPDSEYEVNEGLLAGVDITVESVLGKVVSARKISLKAGLCVSVLALGGCRVEPMRHDGADADVQRLSKNIGYCRQIIGSDDEIELRDSLDTTGESITVVGSECNVFIEEISVGEGYADCRGSARLIYLLRKDSESMPYTVERKLDLSEVVELDGIKKGDPCTAYCVCTGIDTRADGDEGGIEVTVRLRLVARGFADEKMGYVSDAYSTVYKCDCETETVSLPRLSCCAVKNMTFSGSVSADKLIKNGDPATARIISVTADAVTDSTERSEDGERAIVSGNVTFNLLYSLATADGNEELSSSEVQLPFKLDLGKVDGGFDRDFRYAVAWDPRAKLTGGEVELGCEIGVSVSLTETVNIQRVSAISLGERHSARQGGICVCYPESGDSLWSVSKRYLAPVDSVAEENRIDREADPDDTVTLEKLRYLII